MILLPCMTSYSWRLMIIIFKQRLMTTYSWADHISERESIRFIVRYFIVFRRLVTQNIWWKLGPGTCINYQTSFHGQIKRIQLILKQLKRLYNEILNILTLPTAQLLFIPLSEIWNQTNNMINQSILKAKKDILSLILINHSTSFKYSLTLKEKYHMLKQGLWCPLTEKQSDLILKI